MGAELCAFNCGPYCTANSVSLSLKELLASVMLLKCELCHHCCRCELYCWIVIAGVCWTVLLALAWRYVSNAPMLLRTLLQAFHKPSLTSHKAYHQPWLWSQSAIIDKLYSSWTFYAQSTWPEVVYNAVISGYLVLQKVHSKWKPGSFVRFLWLDIQTVKCTGTGVDSRINFAQ